MPANLPPQYFEVEKKYREADNIKDKIKFLREMLAVMPKHKGTEKLQAQIKTKISQLTKELEQEKVKKGRGRDYYNIPKEGAAQVVIVGPPNTGKSSILSVITSAHPPIGDYPFTTTKPHIGMMEYEDIKFQCVDTPPLYRHHKPGWLLGICRNSDMLLFVVDISNETSIEEAAETKKILEEAGMALNREEDREIFDSISKKVIYVGNKADVEGSDILLKLSIEFLKIEDMLPISARTGMNMDRLKELIFVKSEKIRVYTKKPGHKPDLTDPLILKKGSTVLDAADKLRKGMARRLKYAKLYTMDGKGIMVERDHLLKDKDIIEFHFN